MLLELSINWAFSQDEKAYYYLYYETILHVKLGRTSMNKKGIYRFTIFVKSL